MKVRYCGTILQSWKPCEVGWGSVGSDGIKSCCDEPQEENCRVLVDETDPLICPTCGTALGCIQDSPPLFPPSVEYHIEE